MDDTGANDGKSPVLLPPPLRRSAVVVVGLAGLVFAVLAVRYAGTATGGTLDDRVEAVAASWTEGHRDTVRELTAVGDPVPVLLIVALLVAACLLLGRRRLAILAVVGPFLTGSATTLLKPVIGRIKEGDFAYPSGHTAAATALGLVIALLILSLIRPTPLVAAIVLAGGALLTGAGMGFALVAIDFHYLTDTVGGFCTAVSIVLGSALLLEHLAERRSETT